MTPRLSVVIASVNGLGSILECLEKLEALPERDQMEILVLDRRTDSTARTITERFPRVVLHAGLTGKSIPELRWIGMRAARAEWVAVIEDHCMVPPAWAAEILRWADSPYGVVGGPVENGAR
ncbi:MAG: glycosyltransferase, partial [Acidobacteria bacterium]|nr:glycosyltransferase [Acidobacteriota bacterium]